MPPTLRNNNDRAVFALDHFRQHHVYQPMVRLNVDIKDLVKCIIG